MIGYWATILISNETKINRILYQIMLQLHYQNIYHWPWLTHIRDILNDCGMNNIWIEQNFGNRNWLKNAITLRLTDQYKQTWNNTIETTSSLYNYLLIKNDLVLENYLTLLPNKLCKNIMKFRTLNHKLPIEIGKYDGTPRNERKCLKCNLDDIGDEYHYLFKCTFFENIRQTYIPKKYLTNPNIIKYNELMSTKNKALLYKLAKFTGEILSSVH